MIKTFRGLLADGGQDRIRLQTIKGKVGYRIAKFDLFPNKPGQESVENNVLIWKSEQSSVSTSAIDVDFTNGDLLAAGMYHDSSSETTTAGVTVVFDSEIFNQDIYITHTDTNAAIPCNYYLELEVIPLTDMGGEYTTLKDIRTATSTI